MPRKSKRKTPAAVYDASKDAKHNKKAIPGFSSSSDESESDSESDNVKNFGPKNQNEPLISSDEESDSEVTNGKSEADDLSDSSESDDDEVFTKGSDPSNLEAISRAIEVKAAKEAAESHAELKRTYEQQSQRHVLPSEEDLKEEEQTGVNLEKLHARVQEVVVTLSDFNSRRDPGTSRQAYVRVLINDLCTLYNYLPELIELFLDMFSAGEAVEFIEAQESDRPVVIRTNTLKTRRRELAQALTNRGVNLDPLDEWSKVGLKIYQSKVPLGATPEYLAGHYMLQSAASMLPVMALDPQPNEKVLDMCSAPGGKTSYVAQLMANTGTVIANDLRADRINAVVSNLHRLGVRNTVVVNYDGRAFPRVMGGFDRVLLDAPCSGLGVISRDQAVKMTRTVKDILRTAHLQKELLRAAVDAVDARKSGVIVYSTCSVSVFENEMVVDYILRNRDVKIVDTGLPFGKKGFTKFKEKHFHPSLALTRRYYPHSHNLDGFYVCKLQKLSNSTGNTGTSGKASGVAKQTIGQDGGGGTVKTASTGTTVKTKELTKSGMQNKRKRSRLPSKVLKWRQQQREERKKKKLEQVNIPLSKGDVDSRRAQAGHESKLKSKTTESNEPSTTKSGNNAISVKSGKGVAKTLQKGKKRKKHKSKNDKHTK